MEERHMKAYYNDTMDKEKIKSHRQKDTGSI